MEGTKFFVSSILFADETNTIWIKIARECFWTFSLSRSHVIFLLK
jgi:hypothetical protein